MIDKQYGLIIERDGKEGVADKQCIGKNTANCFNNVAKFKRIYKVKLENGEAKK